jgi:hypothetical protein
MPQVHRARIIGFLHGKPCYSIGGGSQPPVEPDPLGDLIGGQQDDPPNDGGQPQDPPNDGGAADQPPAWWGAASAAIEAKLTSEIDRRINGVVQRRTTQQQQPPQQGQPTQGQPAAAAAQGPAPEDLREARAVFRETLADEVKLAVPEREFVNAIQPGLIATAMQRSGGDPVQVGEEVAKQVASQIAGLRKHYQKVVVNELRQRGLLVDTAGQSGQQNTPLGNVKNGAPGVAAGWVAGQNKADELLAARGQARPGPKTN